MNVQITPEMNRNVANAWSTILRGLADVPSHGAPLAVLSRDDAVARLYGRPAVDLQRAAKRRRFINAVLEVRRQNTEGK